MRRKYSVGNNSIFHSSTPSKAIPDNNPTGVSDMINVRENGTISSVKVDLNLTHTYIGDLSIKLISPRGTPATLHERNGGGTDNIVKTFDLQNASELSRFKGEPTSGNWTLMVADVAAADRGTINKWTLTIDAASAIEIKVEESPGISIPDNNPTGIERSLLVMDTGTIKEIEIGIDITHTYIADLIVNLVSPDNNIVSLHSRTGGSADNIIRVYNFFDCIKIIAFKKPICKWELEVAGIGCGRAGCGKIE